MDHFDRYINEHAPQYNNDKKLRRYNNILVKIAEKYWDTGNKKRFYHQYDRICKMANKDYPDMIFMR